MSDGYYDEFLDSDDLEESTLAKLPSWVNPKNSSQKAYEAIEELKKVKQQFIRKHGLKSQYTTKSTYQISKADVARLVGSEPQPLFNSCSYSGLLKRYLDDVNKELDASRERRIRNKGGLRQKKKDELVKELQETKVNNDRLLVDTIDTVYERTINNLPLDVKRKLGLI
tara:strand:- start:12534 stop:13040 length:507 start_codon:yes stop_codon:yes gene_type:complete